MAPWLICVTVCVATAPSLTCVRPDPRMAGRWRQTGGRSPEAPSHRTAAPCPPAVLVISDARTDGRTFPFLAVPRFGGQVAADWWLVAGGSLPPDSRSLPPVVFADLTIGRITGSSTAPCLGGPAITRARFARKGGPSAHLNRRRYAAPRASGARLATLACTSLCWWRPARKRAQPPPTLPPTHPHHRPTDSHGRFAACSRSHYRPASLAKDGPSAHLKRRRCAAP